MTIFKLELRRDRAALAIWTAVLAFMLAVCVVIFPEIRGQFGAMGEMLDEMGGLSQALGMTSEVFTDFTSYFAAEAGSLLGLGGAFFAALLGARALGREERERTAEFLLTHPVTRTGVVAQKLLAVVVEIAFLDLVTLGAAGLLSYGMGLGMDGGVLLRFLLVFALLQLQLAALSLAVSAFFPGGGTGLCLGLAAVSYFMSLLAALAQPLAFLRYLTPFGYADGAGIVAQGGISLPHLAAGLAITAAAIAATFWQYRRKDIG